MFMSCLKVNHRHTSHPPPQKGPTFIDIFTWNQLENLSKNQVNFTDTLDISMV